MLGAAEAGEEPSACTGPLLITHLENHLLCPAKVSFKEDGLGKPGTPLGVQVLTFLEEMSERGQA